jgi:hypothetical protein
VIVTSFPGTGGYGEISKEVAVKSPVPQDENGSPVLTGRGATINASALLAVISKSPDRQKRTDESG